MPGLLMFFPLLAAVINSSRPCGVAQEATSTVAHTPMCDAALSFLPKSIAEWAYIGPIAHHASGDYANSGGGSGGTGAGSSNDDFTGADPAVAAHLGAGAGAIQRSVLSSSGWYNLSVVSQVRADDNFAGPVVYAINNLALPVPLNLYSDDIRDVPVYINDSLRFSMCNTAGVPYRPTRAFLTPIARPESLNSTVWQSPNTNGVVTGGAPAVFPYVSSPLTAEAYSTDACLHGGAGQVRLIATPPHLHEGASMLHGLAPVQFDTVFQGDPTVVYSAVVTIRIYGFRQLGSAVSFPDVIVSTPSLGTETHLRGVVDPLSFECAQVNFSLACNLKLYQSQSATAVAIASDSVVSVSSSRDACGTEGMWHIASVVISSACGPTPPYYSLDQGTFVVITTTTTTASTTTSATASTTASTTSSANTAGTTTALPASYSVTMMWNSLREQEGGNGTNYTSEPFLHYCTDATFALEISRAYDAIDVYPQNPTVALNSTWIYRFDENTTSPVHNIVPSCTTWNIDYNRLACRINETGHLSAAIAVNSTYGFEDPPVFDGVQHYIPVSSNGWTDGVTEGCTDCALLPCYDYYYWGIIAVSTGLKCCFTEDVTPTATANITYRWSSLFDPSGPSNNYEYCSSQKAVEFPGWAIVNTTHNNSFVLTARKHAVVEEIKIGASEIGSVMTPNCGPVFWTFNDFDGVTQTNYNRLYCKLNASGYLFSAVAEKDVEISVHGWSEGVTSGCTACMNISCPATYVSFAGQCCFA